MNSISNGPSPINHEPTTFGPGMSEKELLDAATELKQQQFDKFFNSGNNMTAEEDAVNNSNNSNTDLFGDVLGQLADKN